MTKSKVASIRALQELLEIVQKRKNDKFSPILSDAEKRCRNAKSEICLKIEKEIEEYAIKQYSSYNVAVVPVCHRSSSYKNDDIIRPELRVKNFLDTSSDETYKKLQEEADAASKLIDDWYFQAVQAVASQIDLPATPEF